MTRTRVNASALCPECRRSVAAFLHHGRLIFTFHTQASVKGADPCEASGWLVEDDEVTG